MCARLFPSRDHYYARMNFKCATNRYMVEDSDSVTDKRQWKYDVLPVTILAMHILDLLIHVGDKYIHVEVFAPYFPY